MELIDNGGNLFEAVNVIHALVVLLVLASSVAGVSFIGSDIPELQPETHRTYATLDVGTQPAYIMEAINQGDTYESANTPTLTVTDVHLTLRGDEVGMKLRVQLNGPVEDGTLQMEDVRNEFSNVIQAGMTKCVGGRSVTSLTDVHVEPSRIIATGDNGSLNVVDHSIDREVTLTADLQVCKTVAGPRFKDGPPQQGSAVIIHLGSVTVRATIVSVSGRSFTTLVVRRLTTIRGATER